MKPFFRYILRTTDVEGAHAFYRAVLGDVALSIFPLHDVALARGAKPHWLGCIDVGADVESAAAVFLERGATSLAPIWTQPNGFKAAVMRDPGGAVVALASPAASAERAPNPPVVWHVLHTHEVARAVNNHRELFGWDFRGPVDVATSRVAHPFGWEAGLPAVGSMMDVSLHLTAHPHWLFQFATPDLDAASAKVRANGGTTLEPARLPSGQRFVVCEDAQGAAFALGAER
jgi:predicted enzyme related to lactoylglutathione lyase